MGTADLDLSGLSRRERQVLASALRGGSARELANELGVSESTVRSHLAHIYEKLGVTGRIELLARAQPTLPPMEVNAEPSLPTSQPRPSHRVLWASGAIIVVLALTGGATLGLGRTSRFSEAGLAFDYPSGWAVHTGLPRSTGFGQTIAVLGTLPWGDCDAADLNCHYREHLGPGQIEVEVDVSYLQVAGGICGWALTRPDLAPRSDGPAVSGTQYLRLLGRPAIFTDWVVNGTDYYGSDGWREWLIAAPGSTTTTYRVAAKWHGPGDEAMLHDLDEVVRTLQLPSAAVGEGATDCSAPFPAA